MCPADRTTHSLPEHRLAPRLSAFLIVHNEARHLADCLRSLAGVADEIVVLDDGSTDATREIAAQAGARVAHRAFDEFGKQKQAALELTTGEWVLSIDADERLSPSLADEIRQVLRAPVTDGYWIRRELIYLGARLRHGGAGDDWVLRLARRDKASFELLPVHEHMLIAGGTARLRGTMEHIKYRTLSEHLQQMDRYTTLSADHKATRGRTFSAWHVFRIPWELFSRLVIRGGVLDGRPGIIWGGMAAFYSFLKYAKLWRGDTR